MRKKNLLIWNTYYRCATICRMKQKELSNLEQEVMDIVWELKQASIRDVLNKINKHKQIAYNTVGTILTRLENKGLVVKKAGDISHIYKPKISKELYGKVIIDSFMQRVIHSFGKTAISSFAESIDKLPAEERKDLLRMLEKHDKNK